MNIEPSNDLERFSKFEHQGWETVSRGYEKHIASVTSQSVEAVMDAAKVTQGMHVLDVCCGPGMLAAAAMARGAQSCGVDFSKAAIKIASTNAPGATFHECDAQSLPFSDNTFDAVTCGFGIIHIPEPDKALTEMHRVLKPGGHVAISLWLPPDSNNGFGLLFGSIMANADRDLGLPPGPDFFQFSAPEKLNSALMEAGFFEPSTNRVNQIWELKDSQGLFDAILEGTVRTRALITAQSHDVQETISSDVAKGMEKYASIDGHYRVPMPALVGSAKK